PDLCPGGALEPAQDQVDRLRRHLQEEQGCDQGEESPPRDSVKGDEDESEQGVLDENVHIRKENHVDRADPEEYEEPAEVEPDDRTTPGPGTSQLHGEAQPEEQGEERVERLLGQ